MDTPLAVDYDERSEDQKPEPGGARPAVVVGFEYPIPDRADDPCSNELAERLMVGNQPPNGVPAAEEHERVAGRSEVAALGPHGEPG
jgi:hypothetical protein